MRSIPPARALPAMLGACLLVAAAATPAHAVDAVLLVNGNIVYGEIDDADIAIVTPTGAVQASRGDLAHLTLNTVLGDILQYRNGGAVTGVADRASYAVRLRSGQTLTLGRDSVDAIHFGR